MTRTSALVEEALAVVHRHPSRVAGGAGDRVGEAGPEVFANGLIGHVEGHAADHKRSEEWPVARLIYACDDGQVTSLDWR